NQAGVERVPRVAGASGGRPVLEDGRVLDVANVVWATGFGRDFSWIKLPVFDEQGEPIHQRGVVGREPGLYFVGLPFQSSLLSGLVAGAGPDARHVVQALVTRARIATGRKFPTAANGVTCRPKAVKPTRRVGTGSTEADRLPDAR